MVAKTPELALMLPVAVIVPEVLMFPFEPVIEKLVAVTSLAPNDNAVTISGSDRSIAVVIPPAAD